MCILAFSTKFPGWVKATRCHWASSLELLPGVACVQPKGWSSLTVLGMSLDFDIETNQKVHSKSRPERRLCLATLLGCLSDSRGVKIDVDVV